MDKFRDVSYTYEYDNPFENDPQKVKLNALIKYISNHPNDFMTSDYINKILFKSIKPEISKVFNKSVVNVDNIEQNPICNEVKKFIRSLNNIPKDLARWAGSDSPVVEGDDEYEEDEEECEENEENNVSNNANANVNENENEIVRIDKNKFAYSLTEGITNYDISSNKLLSIKEVRELSINIARSLLAKNLTQDIEIQKIETKKRKDLILQIQKYKNIKKIAALLNDDITDMSINQLELCLEQCKKYHETFKLQEIVKSSLNGGKAILSAALPNGIRIGKKRIKMNSGLSDELINTLFDSTSVIGKSFDNIVQKHNFHINDDALILLKIGELFIKNIKVEDVPEEELQKINEKKQKQSGQEPEVDQFQFYRQPSVQLNRARNIQMQMQNQANQYRQGIKLNESISNLNCPTQELDSESYSDDNDNDQTEVDEEYDVYSD